MGPLSHYLAAERLLDADRLEKASAHPGARWTIEQMIEAAKVHAMLAQVALDAQTTQRRLGITNPDGWSAALEEVTNS